MLLFLITITATAQEVSIAQHSSFCEATSGLGGPGSYRERIKEARRKDNNHYLITAILVRDCDQPVFPLKAFQKSDTLFVTTSQIETAIFNLTDGSKVSERYNEEECRCAYELRMEIVLDTTSVISIDERILEKTDEKFVTQPIRYLIFKGDTTGFEDKYGRRQGYYYIERKKDILKTLYKDGSQVSCELLTLDGKLIAKEKDCHPFIERNRK
jgi:hypothetical protein